MRQARVVPKKRWGMHRIVGALIKGLFWGWILSLGYSVFYWNLQGFDRANTRVIRMLRTEKNRVQRYADAGVLRFLISTHTRLVQGVRNMVHSKTVHVAKGQLKVALDGREKSYLAPTVAKLRQFEKGIKGVARKTAILAKNTTRMWIGKIVLWVLALPLLGLGSFLGMIDGLVQRHVRTAEWGRASSFLFHRYLQLIPVVLFVSVLGYVLMPLWIPPVGFFLGVAGVMGIVVSRTVAHFKQPV